MTRMTRPNLTPYTNKQGIAVLQREDPQDIAHIAGISLSIQDRVKQGRRALGKGSRTILRLYDEDRELLRLVPHRPADKRIVTKIMTLYEMESFSELAEFLHVDATAISKWRLHHDHVSEKEGYAQILQYALFYWQRRYGRPIMPMVYGEAREELEAPRVRSPLRVKVGIPPVTDDLAEDALRYVRRFGETMIAKRLGLSRLGVEGWIWYGKSMSAGHIRVLGMAQRSMISPSSVTSSSVDASAIVVLCRHTRTGHIGEVADALGVQSAAVRQWVQCGVVHPRRGSASLVVHALETLGEDPTPYIID